MSSTDIELDDAIMADLMADLMSDNRRQPKRVAGSNRRWLELLDAMLRFLVRHRSPLLLRLRLERRGWDFMIELLLGYYLPDRAVALGDRQALALLSIPPPR